MLTLKNKYGRQKPIVQGLEGVGLGGSVLRLNPECRILNPENTVPDPHNWRYAKSIPPQIAIEQNRRTERKKNKMGTQKMKLQLKIVFRINSPFPSSCMIGDWCRNNARERGFVRSPSWRREK